ncbi:thermonuclease family protein [Ferruginivarius sediminum]|uniref:Thermonuclease family protein n=1 Tax=Ferruginivarius sediminum TaxID=2661937 RepID=A0A369TAK9_9PROT|nr:thermonuclease family protein [Ferruginivarius sediminum]RDD62308.1 thermonuclease family protein [Ferruginivarius sediminum]
MRIPVLAIALLLVTVPPAEAGEPGIPEVLESAEAGEVVEIVDGDTLILADGREVRLVGLQAPKLPLGRPGFEAWPLSDEAKAALAEMTLDREVTPAYGGRRTDRHRRQLAHLFLEDGTWVQAEMLRKGLARVYSFADNRALVPRLLEFERAARAARRGIWDHPYYQVRTPWQVGEDVGSFQLVEGRVMSAAVVRGRAYLNFGRNWREDFTVTLTPKVRRLFEDEGIEPESYEGRVVRVRGWIESYNGPMIEATHPEQIEVLQ